MTGKLEHPIQQMTRLFAAKMGALLMRNNSGVATNPNGQPVRFGLMNDSSRVNKEIKSSDLIGITPVVVTPDMVGMTLGVFTAIESKREDWKPNPKCPREKAQRKFHEIVRSHGGFAGFASRPEDLTEIIPHDMINTTSTK